MATNGYHIFYNPSWVSELSNVEIRGVIAHEILHVIFAHPERRKARQPVEWNIACDFAINQLLFEQGFVLPVGALFSRDFLGMTAEEIYERIKTRGEPELCSSVPLDRSDDMDGAMPEIASDLLDRDDPRCAPLQADDRPDRQQIEEIRSALRSAALQKLTGRAAASFSTEIVAAEKSRVDWRSVMRCWLSERVHSDWSTYPFSKRYLHRGLFLPSPRTYAPSGVVLAIDTSGSMDNSTLAAILSELRAFASTFSCEFTVIEADAYIQRVIEVQAGTDERMPEQMEFRGRGGTDFRPVFEWIQENRDFAQTILIYFTDGFGSYPKSEPRFPVLWLLTGRAISSEKVPFGQSIILPT
jgi:predicted metal-dependent peptidase